MNHIFLSILVVLLFMCLSDHVLIESDRSSVFTSAKSSWISRLSLTLFLHSVKLKHCIEDPSLIVFNQLIYSSITLVQISDESENAMSSLPNFASICR